MYSIAFNLSTFLIINIFEKPYITRGCAQQKAVTKLFNNGE